MGAFNFGALGAMDAVSNKQQQLKPWTINKVRFKGARKDVIEGKKHPGEKYEVLRVRFEGDDGYYEESLFYPKEGDDQRRTFQRADGSGEYEVASNFETTMAFIAQVATVLNPEGFKRMQELSGKFKSFDDVVKAFIAITDPAKDKETNLKLAARNRDGRVDPAIPRFVGINRQGELFISENFIGDKLFFTSYDLKQKARYENAAPTPAEALEANGLLGKPAEQNDSEDLSKLLGF